MADGGHQGVDGIARPADEMVAAHPVLRLQVSDDQLDGELASQFAFDGVGDTALPARGVDPQAGAVWCVVAAVSGIGIDAGERDTDLLGDRGDDGGQGVTVIGVARQGCDVGDELAAVAAPQRCGDGSDSLSVQTFPLQRHHPSAKQANAGAAMHGPLGSEGPSA